MAVAAPARRTAPAPAPSRTTPPKRKAAPARPAPSKKAAPARAPRTRPKPRSAAAAPARKAPARKAPARRAPARRAPARKAPSRQLGGQLIPLAGRTAVAVSQLPDSGLVVRLTRGRAWIGVLGVLLAGIVALNVITLSFSASASRIDQQAVGLEQESSTLTGRHARLYGTGAMRHAAGALGLAMPPSDEIHFTDAGPDDVAVAAQRLAAAGG